MYASLSQADIAELTRFLADSARPAGTLRFQELQGFLFAVACSPELVPPSAWLPAISDEDDIRFEDEDEAEAERILGLIIGLYNDINGAVFVRSDNLPPGCELLANVEDNFDEAFANGREFSAYIGLTPRQLSSGGKTNIIGISKKVGNRRLRSILIQGALA